MLVADDEGADHRPQAARRRCPEPPIPARVAPARQRPRGAGARARSLSRERASARARRGAAPARRAARRTARARRRLERDRSRSHEAADAAGVARELRALAPLVEPLADRIEELRNELAVLPRYIEPLRRLLPLVPELAELDESEIKALELDAVALVLNTDDEAVVDALRDALRTELGDRFVLVAARVESDAIGCVIVTPHSATRERAGAPRARARQAHAAAVALRGSLVPRGGDGDGEPAGARSPPSSTGAQQELHALLAPAWRRGRRRASDCWPRSSRSRRWRMRARRAAPSSSSAGRRGRGCPSCARSSSVGGRRARARGAVDRRPRPSRRC